MLNWSTGAYKMTIGVGALGMAGIMADLWEKRVPFWFVATIAMFPFLVFLLVRPGELSDRFVRVAHAFASLWYIAAATVLAVVMFGAPTTELNRRLYLILIAAGYVPCAIVLVQVFRGRYGSLPR
jgi:hypothetical protein